MKRNIEKEYKRCKAIKDFIEGKSSGIMIAGIFAFMTSKLPIFLASGNFPEMMFSTLKDSAIFLAIVIYPLLVLFKFIEKIYKNKVINNGPMPTFNRIIKSHTNEALSFIENCYSWGENLTNCWCPIMLDGWKTKDIIVTKFDTSNYDISPTGDNMKFIKDIYLNYNNYLNREDIKNVIKLDDNMTRIMLIGYRTNYNESKSKLVLELEKTDFLTTKYLWDYYQKQDLETKKQLVASTINDRFFLPNSFCLHLIIETNDNKVICSLSSKQKSSDTPYSLATTLGEQLEESDIKSENGSDYCVDFVERWIKRALVEEFGLNEIFLNEIYNKESNRLLSVDFEGDRYNFSLLAITKIKYNYFQFINLIKKTYQKTEFEELGYIELDEIPKILLSYDKNLKTTSYIPKYLEEEYKLKKVNYHESTHLRLLMLYLHKNGIKNTIDALSIGDKGC